MKVLVVGGTGGMGQGVARDLIKQAQIQNVVLGDINVDPARVQEKLRASEKIALRLLDVNDHNGLVEAIKGVDVVVNCAGPFYKTAVAVAKAAVEARVNYIDICDDYEAAEILFASDIDGKAREAGITVLTGMGSDPGTNNVLVKWYANKLDTVDEVYLYWVVSIAELAGAAWDHSLHMVLGKIPQFIDGKIEYVDGGSGEETERFLDPLGECLISYVGHPQPLTIPRYIRGVKKVVIKGALIPLWVDRLIKEQRDTGFLSKDPIEVKGQKIVPYDLTLKLWDSIPKGRDNGPQASGLKVIVKGTRGGDQVTYTADIVGRMAPGTGLPASIAALMFSAGEIKEKGVVAPEGCINPDKFLAELIKRGARIHQTETVRSMLKVE
ncbi:MAG TPA: saccharopine dehydrogenase NADP-binding domain-containing protein [Syntrophorhabdaceae bacterium]|nr:saccharopine dehydrogenase NADP-binding domain-containing protein [Syntrophorhabdaceae bacterium]HOL06377.1 saccharopine dehydrogenase NADP-binding domain-containing protein [Syntrophorhabdaceae bacterium]HON86043.1 saccharopine dehydrogenase NADP-binding domain-containing protein [Syntrophorhabdaceae bacterium]HOT43064.1 saccharopine dehydrogenase NADP-binding domain-containing protein [Syntrophorhabdaceae bacterium]HPC67558.1 saccharopine dehydrogenase NADP-binding domain-containing protei